MNVSALVATVAFTGLLVGACGGGGGGSSKAGSVEAAVQEIDAASTVPQMTAAINKLVDATGIEEPLSQNMPARPIKPTFLSLLVADQLKADNSEKRLTLKEWYDFFSTKDPAHFPVGGFDALVSRIMAQAPGAKARVAAGNGSRHDRALVALLGLMDIGNGVDRDPTVTEFDRVKQTIVTVLVFVETTMTETTDENCTTTCTIEKTRTIIITEIYYEHCRRVEGIYGWGEACWDLPPDKFEDETEETFEDCTTECHEQ